MRRQQMFNNKRIAAIEEILEWQGKLNEATIGRQDALEQKFEEDNGFHLERVGKLAIICSQLERKVAALEEQNQKLVEAVEKIKTEAQDTIITFLKVCNVKDYAAIDPARYAECGIHSNEMMDSKRRQLGMRGYVYSHKDSQGAEYYLRPDPEPKPKKAKKKAKKSKKGKK
jgi:hypothetical protein